MISFLRSLFRRPEVSKKCQNQLVFPYSEYLHEISAFSPSVTPKEIRQHFPAGERRLFAFQQACRQFPDRADLWLASVETRVELGVYDSLQYEDCIDLLASALPLAIEPQIRDSIEILLSELEEERAKVVDEFGQEPQVAMNPDSLTALARDGRAQELLERLEVLKAEIEPKGIMGAGARDRDLWDTYQAAVQALFLDRQPEAALALVDEFYRRRIGLNLTPIPNYTVQQSIIGFLLQTKPDQARSTVTLWLSNSKMPTICDAVKHHPEIAGLFPD